jgi:hypothetical protein
MEDVFAQGAWGERTDAAENEVPPCANRPPKQRAQRLRLSALRLVTFIAYSFALPSAFAFAHLALAEAARLVLAAGLNLLFFFAAGFSVFASSLLFLKAAHLALAAAAILARPAALIFRFFGPVATAAGASAAPLPRSLVSSFCRVSSRSLISAARRNCCGVSPVREFIVSALWRDSQKSQGARGTQQCATAPEFPTYPNLTIQAKFDCQSSTASASNPQEDAMNTMTDTLEDARRLAGEFLNRPT